MDCLDVEMTSAMIKDNQSPEEALVNLSGETDVLSVSPRIVRLVQIGEMHQLSIFDPYVGEIETFRYS